MKSSDNIAALIYLKSKVHKWKNIALLLGVFSCLLALRFTFGGSLSDGSVADGSSYIANIKIEGVIFEDDFRTKTLDKIAKEESIKAVIVNISSPGGGIVGSEILYNNLRAIAAVKPIVVILGSVAASGGYMAAIASDYIIAHNGTLTGSIGVLMEVPNATELAKKIGLKFHTYKSSPLKASPSTFENSTPKIDSVVQSSINDSYQFFVEMVRDRRGNKIDKKLSHIAFDGRVFTGRQALEVGLVDKVGSKNDALIFLKKNNINVDELSIKDIKIVKGEEKIFDKVFGMIPFLNSVKSIKQGNEIMAIMK